MNGMPHEAVQRSLGILRGEMNSVQKNVDRVEHKVDDVLSQLQQLREDRSFARGIGYVLTAMISATVSGMIAWLGRILK
jgi:tetrahydromethanopterin S-methyltransferase subunit G